MNVNGKNLMSFEMGLKRTLFLSMFLHVVFLSVVLFISADLIKGSRSMPDKNVIFVRLEKDNEGGTKEIVIKKVAPRHIQPLIMKAKEKLLIDTQKTTVLERGKAVNEGKERASMEKKSAEHMRDLHTEPPVSSFPSYDEGKRVSFGKEKETLSPDIAALIANAIARVKKYPHFARKRGMEGTVHVSFSISTDGIPQEIKILKSSGFRILDLATLDIIKQAAPFPYIDSRIEVPVAYRLKDK